MPEDLSDVRHQVALANRMLANEGVLDAFGHVSMRHPADPGRYLLSRSRSPALIESDDILEFTLGPLTPGETKLAAAINLSPGPLSRAWDYWTARAGAESRR